MSHRARTGLLLLLASALGLGAAPESNTFRLKPGAPGANCRTCHEDFDAVLNRRSVHTPVKDGDCTGCHNPHASSHGKLLAAESNEVCVRCHEDIVPRAPRSAHPAAAQGNCVACHDPHGAANANNLNLAGNELCRSCHAPLAEAVEKAAFKHPPVSKSCLSCHTPHASAENPNLLRKGVPSACTGCHKTDAPAFASQHLGYPVGGADCTSCHDPHGSSTRGMLWANVHAPVASKDCSQCHQASSSSEALTTKREGAELCSLCHRDTVEAAFGKTHLHWPVVEGAGCLNCHNPHAAKAKPLLRDTPTAVCGRCHADTIARQSRSATKHEPIEKGECGACHAVHGADNALLLTESNPIELCGTCHDWHKHSSHPIGGEVRDPRDPNLKVDCLSCHRSHGTEHKAFANFDPKMDLCLQCHQTFGR